MTVKVLAYQGDDVFMVDAGKGDAAGQIGVPLARVFRFSTGELSELALPVSSIAARGYWEDASSLADRASVEQRIAALLDAA